MDPLASSGRQDKLSPYAAMGNNPGMMVDPFGLMATTSFGSLQETVSFMTAMNNMYGADNWSLNGKGEIVFGHLLAAKYAFERFLASGQGAGSCFATNESMNFIGTQILASHRSQTNNITVGFAGNGMWITNDGGTIDGIEIVTERKHLPSPDQYGGLESYRGWQEYPFYHKGETRFDRTCRLIASSHREEMLSFGGGGYNMFGGYGRAVQAVEAAAAVEEVANSVPVQLARVIPAEVNSSTLGAPGAADVFVTATEDIAGLNASQIANRLTIPNSSNGFKVIEFSTPTSGLASPINRTNPGFVGFGRTAGGAREFVLPNQPIPNGSTITIVH